MEHEISPNKMRQLIEVMEEDVARTPYARMMEKALPKKKPVTGPFFRGRPGPRGRWPETKVGVKQPGVRPPVVEAPSKPRKKGIKIHEGMLVKDLAEVFGQKVPEVIKKLMELGIMASINQPVDPDAALLVAEAFGMKAEVVSVADREEMLEEVQDEASLLRPRPPVVTIMGHVDHGKTSLLDAIRQTKVTLSEAGGITQHIGAYKVRIHDRDIVFLDTPGHEAFTAMRARGAQVTDIVVLVVAADDGVMPQTKEAINHARAAEVPILVAINKIDKPEAKPERVKQELSEQGLLPEAWGGQTIFAEVSAKKRIGLEHLLEMILLQADVLELKANPEKAARGSVIEAKLDRGRGPVATVLVQNGTVRTGDAFVCGTHYGRVRALVNDEGKKVEEAPPSIPVEVIGCSGVPQAGDAFIVVAEEREARQIALTRTTRLRASELAKAKRITLSELHARIQEGEVRELNVILKGDVQGSVEAMAEALTRLGTEAVKVKILHASVGGITETDVMLASASNAIVLGFNVRPETKAAALAEQEGVDIRTYTVIYDAIADVKAALEGLLAPTLRERVLGRAEVRVTFSISKVGTIAGCYVTDGMVTRAGSGIRVLRDNVVMYEGKIGSLKRFKEDVREVQAGYECGISVEHFNDIKAGDVLECYTVEKEAAKLA
jgi:translation initiation factor IF-2